VRNTLRYVSTKDWAPSIAAVTPTESSETPSRPTTSAAQLTTGLTGVQDGGTR